MGNFSSDFRRAVFSILLSCLVLPAFGQTGNYFLSHFTPSEHQFDNVCFDMTQDDHGILYFASKEGVQVFDGTHWNLIEGRGAVYTLRSDKSGEIFWGGSRGYGLITEDAQGAKSVKLMSGKNAEDIFQMAITRESLFFLSDDITFIHPRQGKGNPQEIKSNNLTGSFTGLFEFGGKVYLNTERGGIFSVVNNQLVKANFFGLENNEVVFSSHEGNTYIVGTADNRVFITTNGRDLREIVLQSDAYVKASVIVSGEWINASLFAVGTLRGGVVFINPLNGETEEIINYNTGLPDNEVFCMMGDRNQNLWIAHDYGFTRASPFVPLHSFRHFDGLRGNLLCARTFEGHVYVGTSLGLFVLQKEELYDEIIDYVNVPVTVVKKTKVENKTKPKAKTITSAPVATPPVEIESKKKGFFSFLRKSKKPEESTTTPPVTTPKPAPAKQTKTYSIVKKTVTEYKQEKRIQRVLRSVQYIYRPVYGIDAKVSQLLEVHGKLLAVGLSGVDIVEGLQAKPMLDEPARYAFANDELFLVSTYDNEMRTWDYVNGSWESTNVLDNLDDQINFIFNGPDGSVAMCSNDILYRIDIADTAVSQLKTTSLPGTHLNESVGLTINKKICIVNGGGCFVQQKDKFIRVDSLGNPANYFAGEKAIWFRDRHRWRAIGDGPQRDLELLNVFTELRFITTDEDELWLITAANELFKFNNSNRNVLETDFPLFVRNLQNGTRHLSDHGNIQLDERESSLMVEVVRPDFVSAQSMEYRYWLKGLHKEWTEWSGTNNVIDVPYFPTGNYTLLVEARDVFGNISMMKPLVIQVRPPYWQRPWFYALEFVVFASLVLISFRLSRKYLLVSRILSLLTIILLIQFIQTAVSSTVSTKTPVLDFLLQVVIALLVLPVEGYLRKLMLKTDTGTGTGLRKFMKQRKVRRKKHSETEE